MTNELTILEKEIEKVKFKLVVDPTQPDQTIAGSPTLYINDIGHLIYPVDTLPVIKTIATSKNLIYVRKGVEGLWCEKSICKTCNRIEKEMGYRK